MCHRNLGIEKCIATCHSVRNFNTRLNPKMTGKNRNNGHKNNNNNNFFFRIDRTSERANKRYTKTFLYKKNTNHTHTHTHS